VTFGGRRRARTPLTPDEAWDYALRLLTGRAMSAEEVRTRLVRRGLPDDDAQRVIRRLVDLRLLDDAVYAEAYVRNRAAQRGRLALRQELRRKGIAEALVDDALVERSDADEATAARALLHKGSWRFAAAHGDDPQKAAAARARAFALLARRGFAVDAARAAVEEVLGAGDDGG
jgi:regulatory protein